MTDYAIEPRAEAYPAAQVPGAANMAEVMAAWQARGLTPMQVTSDELVQTISITHNALSGELTWTVNKMDGIQALGVLWLAMVDIGETLLKAKVRPALSSGNARAMVALEGNTVQMAVEPASDQPVVRGLLAAAILHLIEARADPIETLAGLMRFEVTP